MSMMMGGVPLSEDEAFEKNRRDSREKKEAEAKEEKEKLAKATPGQIQKCIEKLAALPADAWRTPQERSLILKNLSSLNKAQMIKFEGNIEEGRGGHDKEGITVAVDLQWGDWEKDAWMKSAPVLVHEASHDVWKGNAFNQFWTKWQEDHKKSFAAHPKGEALIADEMHAWENELIVYKELKKGGFSDDVLELRLQRKNQGRLEETVRDNYPAWVTLDGGK